MIRKVNLHEILLRGRDAEKAAKILSAVKSWLDENEIERVKIRQTASSDSGGDENDFKYELLDGNHIFHISEIRKICIDYRLRFLSSSMYKNGLPEEAVTKIHQLNKLHQTELKDFKIVAPSKAFRLENYDDPLLFAPIGNGYYYLIHKWGNDMSSLRKLLVLPVKNLLNFVMFCLFLSAFITWMIPQSLLSREVPMASVIVFLFIFKSVIAVLMYGFFMGGRKFNDSMWNSRFYNY